MAKVIEFYIPEYFRKPHKWAPELGKVIEFGSRTRLLLEPSRLARTERGNMIWTVETVIDSLDCAQRGS